MRKQLVANLATRFGLTPLSMLAGFVTAWLVIGHIGANSYASIMIITGLSQLLPFADMGVGAAVMNALASGNSDKRGQLLTLISAQRVLALSAGVLVAVATTIALVDGWTALLGPGVLSIDHVNIAAAAFFGAFGAFVFFQLGYRMLTAIGRNPVASLLNATGSLLALVLAYGGVRLEAGPIWFAIAPTLASATMGCIATILAGRWSGLAYGKILVGAVRFKTYKQMSLRGTAFPMTVIMVSLPALLFSHRLILSHVADPAQLLDYTLGSQIYSPLWGAVSGALIFMWPMFRTARVESQSAAKALVAKASLYMLALGVCVAVGTFVVVPIATWLISHGQTSTSSLVAAGFGALLLVQIAFYPYGVFLTEPRDLAFQAVCVLAMLAIGLPSAVWAAHAWGASGPLWVSAAAILVFQLVPAVVYSRRLTHTRMEANV